MTTNVKRSYQNYKRNYEGEVMDNAGSFKKLQQLTMCGVELIAITQPTYEEDTAFQEFMVTYENDSFSFTYEWKVRSSEKQQLG